MEYIHGECCTENEIKWGDLVRGREHRYRMMYKRTRRWVGLVLNETWEFKTVPLILLSYRFPFSILINTTMYIGFHFRNDIIFLIFYVKDL